MIKKFFIGAISLIIISLGIGAYKSDSQTTRSNSSNLRSSAEVKSANTTNSLDKSPKAKEVCDGEKITSNCSLNGVNYKTYIYHPYTQEKTHTEQVTTYQEKVTGYCTLCNDGTYSPSCAVGRGACSHHSGVAQYNAQVITSVPVHNSKIVTDVPAQDAFYEKVVE
jgi:hypothetical protein